MCYQPLHGFQIGTHPSGKPKYKILGGNVTWHRCGKGSDTPGLILYDYVEIPCGKCIQCRLNYSKDWANRCMLEAQQHKKNYFVTLTYDPAHLPTKQLVDSDSGEMFYHGTLEPTDLTKFIKRLRRHFEYNYNHDNIRFYACGEYGEHTDRPHYHAIIFNLPLNDLEELCTTAQGNKLYLSKTIEEIWGKGNISVGEVTWETCAYTARYIMKKQKGQTKGLVRLHNDELAELETEFTRMSRRPGIAFDYYEKYKDEIYKNDEIIFKGRKGKAEVVKPGKYYDRMFDLDNPEYMKAIKERRREAAENALKIKLEKTTLSKKEYRALEERNKEESIKKLVRKAF